jgi:hypothetical protein
LKDIHKYVHVGIFQNIDPRLGAVTTGTEVARLGAMITGAEVQGYFLSVVDVTAYVTQTWHELSAVEHGWEMAALRPSYLFAFCWSKSAFQER